MTTVALSLYEALTKAGIDEEIARRVSEDVVTRDEAKHFATKADITNLKADLSTDVTNAKSSLERFIFTALVTQFAAVIGLVIALIEVLT